MDMDTAHGNSKECIVDMGGWTTEVSMTMADGLFHTYRRETDGTAD